MRTESTIQRVSRLKQARHKVKLLSNENARLKAYIAALEPMVVRSVNLSPTQLKSIVRRRINLNLVTKS